MTSLQGYTEPILSACLLFLPVAAIFTLPFMIWQYRRYGTIPILRVLVVYAFILYMMCSFLLTVLPLPTAEQLAELKPRSPQLIPFQTYGIMFTKAGFALSQPGTWISPTCWKTLFTSSNFFEILANIVMQIPLGVFLRYYFRCSRRQVLLIGFLVSLFYELTQLTGLFFIYEKAYRLCSVDDLIDNTLGAFLGYCITPLLCALLPSREELDRMSIERGRRITLIRRFTSAVLDWVIYSAVVSCFLLFIPSDSGTAANGLVWSYPLYVLLVFVLGQWRFHGKTLGKLLLKIHLESDDGGKPDLRQLLIRYGLIYLALPVLLLISGSGMLASVMLAFYSAAARLRLVGIILFIMILVTWALSLTLILYRHRQLPHSFLSHTVMVLDRKKQA